MSERSAAESALAKIRTRPKFGRVSEESQDILTMHPLIWFELFFFKQSL